MMAAPFYYRLTEGIRITVRPRYLPDQSRPHEAHFAFAYEVRIENVGAAPARLVSRVWRIHDHVGEDLEVAGEGVVGERPLLAAGGVHEYQSYCVLKSPAGSMEGHFTFIRADGTGFRAFIPRFDLDVPDLG